MFEDDSEANPVIGTKFIATPATSLLLNPSRETNSIPTVPTLVFFIAYLIDSPAGMGSGEGMASESLPRPAT